MLVARRSGRTHSTGLLSAKSTIESDGTSLFDSVPAADAALHPLLARVLAASHALRSAPGEPAPIAELHAVLQQYPLSFAAP